MSLRPKLARLLASLRRRGGDGVAHRCRCRPAHRPRRDGEHLDRWTDLAPTTLSRNARAQIREPQTANFDSDDEERSEKRKGGFLADLQETMRVLARIAIITSVIASLLAAYLITRLTHPTSFPVLLRKGNPASEMSRGIA